MDIVGGGKKHPRIKKGQAEVKLASAASERREGRHERPFRARQGRREGVLRGGHPSFLNFLSRESGCDAIGRIEWRNYSFGAVN